MSHLKDQIQALSSGEPGTTGREPFEDGTASNPNAQFSSTGTTEGTGIIAGSGLTGQGHEHGHHHHQHGEHHGSGLTGAGTGAGVGAGVGSAPEAGHHGHGHDGKYSGVGEHNGGQYGGIANVGNTGSNTGSGLGNTGVSHLSYHAVIAHHSRQVSEAVLMTDMLPLDVKVGQVPRITRMTESVPSVKDRLVTNERVLVDPLPPVLQVPTVSIPMLLTAILDLESETLERVQREM